MFSRVKKWIQAVGVSSDVQRDWALVKLAAGDREWHSVEIARALGISNLSAADALEHWVSEGYATVRIVPVFPVLTNPAFDGPATPDIVYRITEAGRMHLIDSLDA